MNVIKVIILCLDSQKIQYYTAINLGETLSKIMASITQTNTYNSAGISEQPDQLKIPGQVSVVRMLT